MSRGTALSDLENRIAALEDREAIRTLIARYGPCADAGDSAGAAALWAPDGSYRVSGHGEHRGRERIAALLEGETHRALLAQGVGHIHSSPLIEVNRDSAVARTYSCVLRYNGTGWDAHRVAANLWHLERGPAGWQVRERINLLLDGDAAARQLLREDRP